METVVFDILQCPQCCGDLAEQESSLRCSACSHTVPVVGGIPVFLTQRELRHFYTKEPLGKNLSVSDWPIVAQNIKLILEASDFVEALEEVMAAVSSKAYQGEYEKNISQLDLPDKVNRAIREELQFMVEKAHVSSAGMMLDWATGQGICLRLIIEEAKEDSLLVAVDVNLIKVASLKNYLERKGKGKNLYFIASDVRRMPFCDRSFQAVTAWGGFIEVEDSPKAVKESFRILQDGGWFVGSGVVYQEGSESMRIAQELGIETLATRERIEHCLSNRGFRSIFTQTFFEGYEKNEHGPDECPLPAPGDWYSLIVAGGQR